MKQKLPTKIKDARKTLNELNEVRRLQRALGKYKLPNPIQKGWKHTFVVRKDVLLLKNGERFQQILPHINTIVAKRGTDDFKIENDRALCKRLYRGAIRLDPKNPDWHVIGFSKISERQKEKIDWPDFFWTKYMRETVDTTATFYTGINVIYPKCWVLKDNYERSYKSVIVPNMITEIPIIDPVLESREHVLSDKMYNNHYYELLQGRYYRHDDSKQIEMEKLWAKEIRQELNIK